MTDVDVQLVREFFELNHFSVTSNWRQHDPEATGEGGLQLYVENTRAETDTATDILLEPADLVRVRYAVVEIRAWHTDRFYSSLIESNPGVTQFAEPWALGHAQEFFGSEDFKTILVVSELPRSLEQRAQALQRIRRTGIDHVIEFPSVLQGLTSNVVLNGTYTGSPTLQLLQLLKRYRLIRNQQLEFTFSGEPLFIAPQPGRGGEVLSEESSES